MNKRSYNSAGRRRVLAVAVAASLMTAQTGCSTLEGEELSREDQLATGAVAGAIAGGLIGYEFFGSGDERWIAALALGAVFPSNRPFQKRTASRHGPSLGRKRPIQTRFGCERLARRDDIASQHV